MITLNKDMPYKEPKYLADMEQGDTGYIVGTESYDGLPIMRVWGERWVCLTTGMTWDKAAAQIIQWKKADFILVENTEKT